MEYGPEFDDLRGDYLSVDERLQTVGANADSGDDGEGRLADYFERELTWLEREIELRRTDPTDKPETVPTAYELHEQDTEDAMAEEADDGRPDPY